MKEGKETDMETFAKPTEDEIRIVVGEAARSCMAKYPSLAARYFDEGDLVSEFYLRKRPCMRFQTAAHVACLRHHVFTLMNCVALNLLQFRSHQPLTWGGGVDLDAVGSDGRYNHDRIADKACTGQDFLDSVEIDAIIESVSDRTIRTKHGVTYSPRMVASLLAEGFRLSEIAERFGVRRNVMSKVVNEIRDSIVIK